MVDVPTFFTRETTCLVLFDYSAHQIPSKKGCTLKGKKLLPWGASNIFSLRTDPFSELGQNIFD